MRKERAEQLNQELETEEPVEALPEAEIDSDADQPTNDLFGKLLGSLDEAEQRSIEEAAEQAKKLAELNESAKKYLSQFALNLQHDNSSGWLKPYILGLSRNERTEKKQWILSAMRAQAVADYLKDILPSQLRCPVYSWGAGPGGYWVTQESHISKQSQILIAVLRAED